jgi:hypothetical protein
MNYYNTNYLPDRKSQTTALMEELKVMGVQQHETPALDRGLVLGGEYTISTFHHDYEKYETLGYMQMTTTCCGREEPYEVLAA